MEGRSVRGLDKTFKGVVYNTWFGCWEVNEVMMCATKGCHIPQSRRITMREQPSRYDMKNFHASVKITRFSIIFSFE